MKCAQQAEGGQKLFHS